MTCTPGHTPQALYYKQMNESCHHLWLCCKPFAEEDEISRQQAASSFSSPAAASSVSSRSTALRTASSGVGANQSNTSMPRIRNMRTSMLGFTEDSGSDSDNSDGETTRPGSFEKTLLAISRLERQSRQSHLHRFTSSQPGMFS